MMQLADHYDLVFVDTWNHFVGVMDDLEHSLVSDFSKEFPSNAEKMYLMVVE